jgi:hypothetical protein
MSDLDEEKKLIWLGLKRIESDRSVVAEAFDILRNNVEDYEAFQNDLGGVSNYTEFKTYLENHGFSSGEADTFIDRIQNNFEDTDSSGSTYDEFKQYVQNEASSFAQLKNAFNTNQTIGSGEETVGGEKVSGIKFFENDGYTKDGFFVPAGTVEVFGNEIHFSKTGAPAAGEENISYSNLTVSNTSPNKNQTIDISADVNNSGTGSGSVYVTLIEDGVVSKQERVEVPAGQTKTVSFERAYTELKTVEVTIGDLNPITVFVVPQDIQ